MVTKSGSSPPVRGTQECTEVEGLEIRFIPARAGNTSGRGGSASAAAVHPRPCGEHIAVTDPAAIKTGSSPPVRGTLSGRMPAPRYRRFIPARAGNTSGCNGPPSRPAVHPRPCGEHEVRLGSTGSVDGSSPPVRGTPAIGAPAVNSTRFIPARAGNTASQSSTASHPPVHPRPCGEHSQLPLFVLRYYGSSPPVRGTREHSGR